MVMRKKHKWDKTWVGFFAGLLLPALIFTVVFFIEKKDISFTDYIKGLWHLQTLVQLASLCVFGNIAVFMLFIRLKYDFASRGVLGATILYAFIVLISRAL